MWLFFGTSTLPFPLPQGPQGLQTVQMKRNCWSTDLACPKRTSRALVSTAHAMLHHRKAERRAKHTGFREKKRKGQQNMTLKWRNNIQVGHHSHIAYQFIWLNGNSKGFTALKKIHERHSSSSNPCCRMAVHPVVHPRELTWNLKMPLAKRKLLGRNFPFSSSFSALYRSLI